MNVNGDNNTAYADPYVNIILDGNSNIIFVKENGDVTFNGDNNTIYVESNVTTQDNGTGNQVINCPGNQAIFDLTNAPDNMCNYRAVEELNASFFEMFPNPSTGSFTIELTNQEDVIVSIYNNTGQIIYSEKYLNENRIDLSPNIPNGIYTVTVIKDSYRSYSKLVMSR